MMPKKERMIQTKDELLAIITSYLGGRVAEELVLGEISTGASDDIKRATSIARAMVMNYGMSSLGPIQYREESGSVFLGRDYAQNREYSSQIAFEIDSEVRRIIDESYQKAREIIQEHRDVLDRIAAAQRAAGRPTRSFWSRCAMSGRRILARPSSERTPRTSP